jgi:hypothetical protein
MPISRTPAGEVELTARALPLSVPARRLLGILSAPMTAEAVAAQFRFGEWERHVADLVGRGLLVREADSPVPAESQDDDTTVTAAPAPSGPQTNSVPLVLTDADINAIRRKAVRIVNDNLGPSGESVALRLERANSQAALVQELHAARRILHQMRGRDAADELYDRVIALAFGPNGGAS